MLKADDACLGEGGRTSSVLAIEDRSLKSACQNAIVLSVLMLSDSFNQRLVSIVLCVGSPLKRWHVGQSKQLRDNKASFTFMKEQIIQGKYMAHVEEMMVGLTSCTNMEECGFVTEPGLKQALTCLI